MNKNCQNCQFGKITEAMKTRKNNIIRYCERSANYRKNWESCDYFTTKNIMNLMKILLRILIIILSMPLYDFKWIVIIITLGIFDFTCLIFFTPYYFKLLLDWLTGIEIENKIGFIIVNPFEFIKKDIFRAINFILLR